MLVLLSSIPLEPAGLQTWTKPGLLLTLPLPLQVIPNPVHFLQQMRFPNPWIRSALPSVESLIQSVAIAL